MFMSIFSVFSIVGLLAALGLGTMPSHYGIGVSPARTIVPANGFTGGASAGAARSNVAGTQLRSRPSDVVGTKAVRRPSDTVGGTPA